MGAVQASNHVRTNSMTVLSGYTLGVRNAALAFRARLHELKSKEYPTQLSIQLLEVLDNAIEATVKRIDYLDEQHRDRDEAEIPNSVLRCGQLLSWIHRMVHLIASSAASDVPRWAIRPMKYEMKKYISAERGVVSSGNGRILDVMIVGQEWGGNFAYDYRLDPLEDTLKEALGKEVAKELTKDLPFYKVVFHFPYGERDNVLAHGAFFHEVGHQIDRALLRVSESIVSQYLTENAERISEKVRNAIVAEMGNIFGKRPGDGQRTLEDAQLDLVVQQQISEVWGILVNWAGEFCADAFATRALGPAYAIIVVTLPGLLDSLNTHSVSHPSSLLRIEMIMKLLSDKRSGDFFEECSEALQEAGVWDLLEAWKLRSEKAATKGHSWSSGGINDKVKQLIALEGRELGLLVLKAVIERTTEEDRYPYYSPEQYNQDIEFVLPLLREGIPINERIDIEGKQHSSNDVATIYNVGTACYVGGTSEEVKSQLSRLLRKSIEMSQIQRLLVS